MKGAVQNFNLAWSISFQLWNSTALTLCMCLCFKVQTLCCHKKGFCWSLVELALRPLQCRDSRANSRHRYSLILCLLKQIPACCTWLGKRSAPTWEGSAVVLPIHHKATQPYHFFFPPKSSWSSLSLLGRLTCFLPARGLWLCWRSGGTTVGFQWKLLLLSLQYLQGREGTQVIWTEQTAEDASYCYTFWGFLPLFILGYKLFFKCRGKTHSDQKNATWVVK